MTTSHPTTPPSPDRIERFLTEIGDLDRKTNTAGAEKAAGTTGIVLMVVAVVVGVGSYVQSTNTADALDQTELVILGLACIVVAIVGAALFLWSRVVSFWRFWMLRQMYENQAHLDALVQRLER